MKLKETLIGLEGLKAKGNLDIDITGIEYNSKNIKEGNIFVAIKGNNTDGHDYISEAINNGAKVIFIEEGCDLKKIKIQKDVTLIMAPNTRIALAYISSNYYGNPTKKFKLIGITGTKGKTTTAFMVKNILSKAGKKVGLIGTIGTYINEKKIMDNERTTPESVELQKAFAEMAKEDVEFVVMEVSSQSLKLHRVENCKFDLVAFTNLSEDHISEKEHVNMQDYFMSKLELFKMCKTGFTNSDDLYGAKIQNLFPENNIITYGIDNYANVMARDITVSNTYADFRTKLTDRNERIKVGIPGRFSVYNALLAICITKKYGIDPEIIKEELANIKVPGRSEIIDNKKDIPIMIDYAHTPKSLESILETVKKYTPGRVICVFGCGGDRDKAKRPIMGEIAGKLADYTIITSDNPRTEKPEEIISEIETGIKGKTKEYKTIVDRKKAITEAIKMANKRDLIVIAGKGHEMYQEVNEEKYPFDEKKIIKEIIDSKKQK
ncbi:MAG: UDP-N-acetylmuramoyl-L-alanyl-D-glutamate--2,6-diaminopimelate ligase [Clostridia bacterium]|nr:UDP-N-acetylmuramoyl-L-alanyl-D-glutamate--2,6-diaminopimelate ligase [Clostridia bacterium]